MKTQIVFIHGGEVFGTIEEFYTALQSWSYDPYTPERKRWRDSIAAALTDTHEFFAPSMPNKQNADYTAWSIWFEKVVPFLRDGVILIGHSLGGGFLLRYLTENKLPVFVAALHLVAPVVTGADLGGFQIDIPHWTGFQSDIQAVHLWHSTDDEIVPIDQSEQFKAKYESAILHSFTDRGHFLTEIFPELLEELQQ